jgi:hypothetical protein
MFLFVAFE